MTRSVPPTKKPSGHRFTRTGSFTLPCSPEVALPFFTPGGERAWVPDWTPTFHSGATDEAGAVWTTDAGDVPVTWVTVIRDDDHVRYARLSGNGTAGYVDVRCELTKDGTRVHVGYDLTATSDPAGAALEQFADGFDDMLSTWRDLTRGVLE